MRIAFLELVHTSSFQNERTTSRIHKLRKSRRNNRYHFRISQIYLRIHFPPSNHTPQRQTTQTVRRRKPNIDSRTSTLDKQHTTVTRAGVTVTNTLFYPVAETIHHHDAAHNYATSPYAFMPCESFKRLRKPMAEQVDNC